MSKRLAKTKVIISILSIGFFTSSLIFSERFGLAVDASSGGAPVGRTGAPGESTCTSCHQSNSGTGQFTIIAPSTYVPGNTYNIQVQHTATDTTRAVWGFELIPLTTSNTMAGTVANLNANTRIRTSGAKSYVTHTDAGSFPNQTLGATWTFSWTAPATNVGPVTMYAAGLQGDNQGDDSGDQTYTRSVVISPGTTVVIHHGFADFDGDGKADVSVFRPSTGIWYLDRSTSGFAAIQWGLAGDKLTPADFDGDDKADLAIWRPDVAGSAAFYILQSTTGTVRIEQFGQTGDEPAVVGDWDGDGQADPAVFRDSAFGSQSSFFFRGSLNNPGRAVTYLPWGTAGDMPMRGDFDGDGKFDAAVRRPSDQVWYIRRSSDGTVRYDHWGSTSDKFVTADFDGDNKTDLAIYRNGTWYIKQSSNGQAAYISWGLATDIPVPADYDGDAKTDAAVFRNGTWYIRFSGTGSLNVRSFGTATDSAIPGAFVR